MRIYVYITEYYEIFFMKSVFIKCNVLLIVIFLIPLQQEGKDKVAALNLDIDATVTEHLTDFDR